MTDELITILYGEKIIKLKPPIIVTRTIKRKWWFDKVEYWVEWEYCSIGPFKSYATARETYDLCPHNH